MTEFIERSCPCCGSLEVKSKIESCVKAEKTSYENLKKYWVGFFKESSFFTYERCTNCGILYNKIFFSGEKLGELYSSMPDNTAGQNLKNLRKTQKGYFDFFKSKNIPQNFSYLEFGPDIGLFTENLETRNFNHFYLIEPNKTVHDKLKKSVNSENITILSDLFDLSAIPDKSLSSAVLIHVLDHMIEPKKTIEQLHKKLVDGGVILIVTHDEKSTLAQVLKSRWPAFCLQHPQLFNVKTTAHFLTDCGFEKITSKKSVNYFSIPYLLQHLFWCLGLGKFQFKEVPWLTIPLRLGNIMTIAQKK